MYVDLAVVIIFCTSNPSCRSCRAFLSIWSCKSFVNACSSCNSSSHFRTWKQTNRQTLPRSQTASRHQTSEDGSDFCNPFHAHFCLQVLPVLGLLYDGRLLLPFSFQSLCGLGILCQTFLHHFEQLTNSCHLVHRNEVGKERETDSKTETGRQRKSGENDTSKSNIVF